MAYCCRDFLVKRHKAPLGSVMTAELAGGTVTYYFSKVQIEAGF